MNDESDTIALKLDSDETRLGLILAELDLAATFCHRASSASDSTTAERNLGLALTAYETAVRFAKDANLTPEKGEQIKEKIERLDAILNELL